MRKTKFSKVLQICDHEQEGRRSYLNVNGRRIRVRGKRMRNIDGTLDHVECVNPSCIMRKLTFRIPHCILSKSSGDLWLLKEDDWRITIVGVRTGFQVRSIEQAICIMKLVFFGLGQHLAEICALTDPAAVRKITEKYINDARLHQHDPKWIEILKTAYTEAYAQWFDTLGIELRGSVLKNWSNFMITYKSTQIQTTENKIVSLFNIIGSSIERAIKIISIATREEFRNKKPQATLLCLGRPRQLTGEN